jgi:hypothetical protein
VAGRWFAWRISIASALFWLVWLAAPSQGAIREIDPGADLALVTQEAADGDTIRLKPGRYTGPLMADGKHLIIEGPPGAEAIIGPGSSNVVVAAVNAGKLDLTAVSVETSAEAPLGLYVQGASMSCANCRVRGSDGRAVYVEAGTLEFAGGSVSVPTGEALLALSGSTVRIEGSNLWSETGSPLVVENAATVEIVGSSLRGSEGAVVTGTNATIDVQQSEFTASGADASALHVEAGGSLTIARSRMAGKKLGFFAVLEPATRVSLSDGIGGGSDGVYIEQKDQGEAARVVMEDFSARASATGDRVAALRAIGPLEIVARESTFLSAGVVAVAASGGAVLSVEGGLLAASELGAAAYGEVPGEVRLVGTIVLTPATEEAPGVAADPATVKLAQALRDDTALAQDFAAAVTEALAPLPDRCLGSCPDPWPSDFLTLAERLKPVAANVATIGFEIVDGAGQARQVPFAVLDFDARTIADSHDGRPVAAAAGSYLIESKLDALLATDVDITAGEERMVQVEAPDGFWIDINQRAISEPRIALFRPVEETTARRIFRAFEVKSVFPARIARRANATEEDVANGLAAARKLVALALRFPKDGDAPAKQRFSLWAEAVYDYALPALAGFGSAEDAKLIADSMGLDQPSADRHPLTWIAYLENRLGLIETGEVAEIASQPDHPASWFARLVLHDYGVSGSGQALFELAADPARFDRLEPYPKSHVGQALLATGDPRVPALAETTIRRALDKFRAGAIEQKYLVAEATWAFTAYLIVFGEPEQKRLVAELLEISGVYYKSRLTTLLAGLAVDTAPFIEEFMEHEEEEYSGDIRATCPVFRLRSRQEFETIYQSIIDAYIRKGIASKPYVMTEGQAVANADRTSRVMFSDCRPDEMMADTFYKNLVDSTTMFPGNWYPAFDTPEEVREAMVQAPSHRAWMQSLRIQSLPPDIALAIWPELERTDWTAFRDERMPLFKAFTKVGALDEEVNAGIERRVYVVRHVVPGEHSGAIAGHVEVRPAAEDGRLVIGIRLWQAPWYWSDGFATAMTTEMGKREYWLHHPYVVEGGRKLIEKVGLARGADAVPLVEDAADAEGFFRFKTDIPADDLRDLVLTVDLGLFEDRRSFAFDLFASGFARGKGDRP